MLKKLVKTKETGITLIALTITIIVLLILAGITIATLTGNNDIITQANKAAKNTGIEQVREQAILAKQDVLSENILEGKETTREDIINAIVEETGGTSEGNLITTPDGKYEIMVKQDNKIEVVEKGQGYIDAEYKEPSPASDFKYTIDQENNTVTITRYIGTDTVVNIPETIEGKPVVELGRFSFSGYNLQSVKIPNTVQTIEQYAFRQNQLTYIDIPKSVTKIDTQAFNNNELNEEQAFIYKRTSTGEEDKTAIVSYGGNQTDIIIPETVKTIEQGAFSGVSTIESVVMGDNVTAIRATAFSFCSNLTKVVIGKNVIRLEALVFHNCNKLLDVEFKGDVPNFNYVVSDDTSEDESSGTGTSEDGSGSVSGTIDAVSSYIFMYNENLKIKVPKGKLQDYKTAKVIVNGEEYYNTIETWFFCLLDEPDESWLDVFYE